MASCFRHEQQIAVWFLLTLFISIFETGPALGATRIADAKGYLFPFCHGEKMVYRIEWFFLDAGLAVSAIPEITEENGRKLIHFSLHTTTTNLMANIWTMDDRFDSYWDMERRSARRLIVKIRESTYKKDKDILFDHEQGVAIVRKDDKPPTTIPIQEGIQDFFTAGHYSRTLPLEPKKKYIYPVFEDDKNYNAEVTVLKKERIKVMDGKGEIDTIMIHPKVSFEGAFISKGDLYVWLSDDIYRAPVKFKIVTLFGPVYLTLIEYEGVDLDIIMPKENGK